ncbi:hypothetical protein ACWEOR_05420, partial [Micromonospora chalcea]
MLADVALDLPVRPVLPALVEALRDRGAAVLVAPPGTGKTTTAPLAAETVWAALTDPDRLAEWAPFLAD